MKFLAGILTAVALLCAAEVKVGKPFTLKTAVTVDALLAQPEKFVDKTVQVKGKVTEVCQAMGCWMEMVGENGKGIHLQFEHGAVEIPKDSAGKMAVAEGKLAKTELTHDEAVARAQEEAKDKGRKFDPTSVKGGMTLYEIEGTGALIR
jgi:hypothetical protein